VLYLLFPALPLQIKGRCRLYLFYHAFLCPVTHVPMTEYISSLCYSNPTNRYEHPNMYAFSETPSPIPHRRRAFLRLHTDYDTS